MLVRNDRAQESRRIFANSFLVPRGQWLANGKCVEIVDRILRGLLRVVGNESIGRSAGHSQIGTEVVAQRTPDGVVECFPSDFRGICPGTP